MNRFVVRVAAAAGMLLLFLPGSRSTSRADDLFRVVSAEKCDALDIPDAPLRAFRTPDGSITAFATHYRNRAFGGRSFDTMAKNCSVAYEGSLDPDPSHFDYKTWITA